MMPNIPISSPLGYIGVFLAVLGIFLILAGFEVIRIRQITIPAGKKTYIFGIMLTLAGFISILLETSAPLIGWFYQPTVANQTILLRGVCGSDYIVNANEPVLIYYGGWGVKGLDLTQQWTTSLTANLTIDDDQISGEQHTPVDELPLNCTKDKEDIYWIFFTTTVSGFSPGIHEISVTYNTLRALPDELGGKNYEPGIITEPTFKIIAK